VPQEAVTLDTSDELRLEARLAVPQKPTAALVICHPHPLMDGSMSSSLIPAIQRRAKAAGMAALRFNFRGVRRSEGRFEGGLGEQKDVTAALDLMRERFPQIPLRLAGWSFGSLVGLAAAAGTEVDRLVLVAPPVSVSAPERLPDQPAPEKLEGWDARIMAICGTQDGYSRPADAKAWGQQLLGDRFSVHSIDGADHSFSQHTDEMLDALIDHLVTT
jgi:alpha/beta superfamily hydrolase